MDQRGLHLKQSRWRRRRHGNTAATLCLADSSPDFQPEMARILGHSDSCRLELSALRVRRSRCLQTWTARLANFVRCRNSLKARLDCESSKPAVVYMEKALRSIQQACRMFIGIPLPWRPTSAERSVYLHRSCKLQTHRHCHSSHPPLISLLGF